MTATVSLIGCSKDEENENNNNQTTYEESNSFEIIYMNRELEAGETLNCNLTAEELEFDDAEVSLYVKNISSATAHRVYKVEFVEGPDSMKKVPVCYGQCTERDLPYTSDAVNLAAGQTDATPIQIHLYPSNHGDAHTGTYKITVGEGQSLSDPQVCFLKFSW